ncbi:MAG: precorrin-2 C(20)-methyltransferase [Alphaproteobacteria bacterium]|nr:precorrin-2 C(20)-methyltransferase [Alphaproteobacteria bacterium]
MTNPTQGTLYGVGTGPGDPELVTRKAWRITQEAGVVAYPSAEGGDSFARRIMADAIAPDAIEIEMPVPMVSGRAPAQAIYDDGAEQIRTQLKAGRDVVVLCEGDPLFYGSFMYILARLRDEFSTRIIPGVTSMTACASAHNHALVARNDVLTVLPGTQDDATLSARIDDADAVVIMKIGRHLGRIKSLLMSKGLAEKSLYVSHASLPHQQAEPLTEAPDTAPYFSMILLYKGDDPWI